ncbi:hypothetical protein M0812_17410 [Anaeramoeba flamelloides]|uniref:Uncharacterized protein n=1 Tax=Anaeramoeba flamelloides TaxID=1746091 RepID=A0AAV7ZAV8_9EUKA|nr:hypothetical protein M0812_17410 [Anaeramoeba flamelloides]
MFNLLPTYQITNFEDNYSPSSEQEETVDFFGYINYDKNTKGKKKNKKNRNKNRGLRNKKKLCDEKRFELIFDELDQTDTSNSDDEANSFAHGNFISIGQSSSESNEPKSPKYKDNIGCHRKSLPISINLHNIVLEEENPNQTNALTEVTIDPQQYIKSLQTEIERTYDKSFQVPSKRLPSWKLY